MGVEVKFCGLTRPADAAAASRAGATYLGVIFAGGPRHLAPHAARGVLDGAGPGAASRRARRVGVFGIQRPDEVGLIAADLELDIVQLHADPTVDDVDAVRSHFAGEVWAVLRIDGRALPDAAEPLAVVADAILIDAKAPGSLGGTGRTLDWRRLAGALDVVRAEARLVLAGGLTADNVAAAIAVLRPDVVDVSSGVESAPGIKDHVRVRAFASAAGVLPRE